MTDKTAQATKSKKRILIGLLKRKNGATLDDIITATGWQRHSSRAALSGLRKAGFTIESEAADKGRRYNLTAEPAQ